MEHQKAPSYIERLVVFLSPDASITLDIGNQRLNVSCEELERIIHNRMLHHVLLVEVIRNGENGHVS